MKNSVLFLVASLVIALAGYGLVRPHKPPPKPDPYAHLYVEAEYRLGPCALFSGNLRNLDSGIAMMEGETLPPGDYYCEAPPFIEDACGVFCVHQYALVHVERPPTSEARVIHASTAPPPRPNWQPGADRNWICRITVAREGFIAICEDGRCYSFRLEDSPGTAPPPNLTETGISYSSSGRSCGIRR